MMEANAQKIPPVVVMTCRWHANCDSSRVGVSANRVTNLLVLLKLAPAILDAIRALRPGTPVGLVTERRLRALTGLPHGEQLRAAQRFIPALVRGRKTA
jgi:hypothetical protein